MYKDKIRFKERRKIATLSDENVMIRVEVPIYECNGEEMVFFKDLVEGEKNAK